MKYKIGDKVRILIDKGNFTSSDRETIKKLGTDYVVTIQSVNNSHYIMKELRNNWVWTDGFLELAKPETILNDGPIENRAEILDLRIEVKKTITKKGIKKINLEEIKSKELIILGTGINKIIDYQKT